MAAQLLFVIAPPALLQNCVYPGFTVPIALVRSSVIGHWRRALPWKRAARPMRAYTEREGDINRAGSIGFLVFAATVCTWVKSPAGLCVLVQRLVPVRAVGIAPRRRRLKKLLRTMKRLQTSAVG